MMKILSKINAYTDVLMFFFLIMTLMLQYMLLNIHSASNHDINAPSIENRVDAPHRLLNT